jgi:hypothetical protein
LFPLFMLTWIPKISCPKNCGFNLGWNFIFFFDKQNAWLFNFRNVCYQNHLRLCRTPKFWKRFLWSVGRKFNWLFNIK